MHNSSWKGYTEDPRAATRSLLDELDDESVRVRPYSSGKRAMYGIIWAIYTLGGCLSGWHILFGGYQVSGRGMRLILLAFGVLLLAFGVLAGIYDYKIWTWRARHLWWFVVFH